ncbi:MAG: sigma-70 family RNA polymerase sigma factor [Bacteroidota bacterium]
MAKEAKHTDQQIIDGIRAGGTSKQRFTNYIYEQYAGFVYKGMRQYRLTKEEALDAYTDAVVGLCRRIEQADFQMDGNLPGYLYRSFCNRCVDRVRKHTSIGIETVELMPQLPETARGILKELLLKEEFSGLLQLMNQLGERCKQILLDADYWGFSVAEMVEKFEFKDANGLSSQKYRCMTKLRKLISARRKRGADV